jgi:hypothetical protein
MNNYSTNATTPEAMAPMNTNAERLQSWRDANPGSLITESILMDAAGLTTLLYADLQGADLRGANLRGTDLRGANLHSAYLRDANIPEANLWRADLRGADLRGANLRGTDLRCADLQGANLRDANIQEANLRDAVILGAYLQDANLQNTDLRGANLRGAYLRDTIILGANLQGAYLQGANLQDIGGLTMQLRGMPSGELILFPRPDGWWLYVGCWEGTPGDLRELVAADDKWPEAEGAEIARRRPYLEAALSLIDLHIAAHPGVIESLAQKWGQL